MAQLNKGSLLLRCAAHALQVGLKEIPGVGAVVELGQGWFEIFRSEYHKANFQERILQLEGAPAMSPQEARVIAGEVIKAKRLAGAVISKEKAEAIADLLAFVPATIKERTQATLHQAKQRGTALQTVLPVADDVNPTEQEAFYRSLLPARRPRFQVGQVVPNANPNWHLTEFLATGGFGEVWEVQHARLRFAIKFCLDQASAKALKREAEALFTLREQLPEHPHIVRLVDINLTAEPYWLAFDFVDGGTLEALMRAAPLDWQESLNWFRPIVEAVAAVHRINIVHRDLKPANILLTTDGVPKIADFGIGKITAENETVMRATRNQYTLLGAGSSGYMSREQCLGLPAHPTDDIYALGVMLWQMLTHRLEAPDLQMVMELQQLEVPQALKTVLLECLTQPREYRPADASVLLAMLPSQAGGSLQEELAALNQQLAELQAQEAKAAQHSEAAEQRELARQRLQKQEEIARKQRQVDAEAARQQVYETALVDDRAEQAEMNEQAKARLEARLAELRQLVEQKHQRGGAPQPLQSALMELQQVDELIKKTEADYAQEQTTQQKKNQKGLQKALAELGEFQSAPRDRFEKTKEYEQRVVREKAEYAAQQEKIHTSWQEAWKKLEKQIAEARLQNLEVLQKQRTALLNQEFDIPPAQLVLQLTDYDADEELMQFEIIAEEIMPGERYRTQGATLSIAPQEAKICWQRWEQDRQLLVPYFLLGLDAEAKPKLIAAGFETAEGQRYCVSAAFQVEPSMKAKEAERQRAAEKLEQQKREAEKLERQKREAEKLERQKREAEQLEQQKREAEKLEQQKREAEKLERQKREAEKLERQKREAEKLERQKREAEKLERQKREAEQLEQQKREAEKLEQQKREAEKLERQKREAEAAQQRKREAEEAQRQKSENKTHDQPKTWFGRLATLWSGTASSADESSQSQAIPVEQNETHVHTKTIEFEIVIVNAKGEIIQRESKQAQCEVEDLGNGVTLEMVSIPGGTFMMGSPENEKEHLDREGPQHSVTVQPFWMGKCPITQRQWQAVMGNNPAWFKGDNRPVEKISWHEVVKFCQRLSEKTGKTYRLPSEAEWEYACRAGTTTPFYFGETITTDLVNYHGDYPYAAAPKGIYREETTEVGIFPPNAFGLYDMHGNVWEWCADPWHDNYNGAPTDGSVWQKADSGLFVLRGGSWFSVAWSSRAAYRNWFVPADRADFLGVRLARQ